MIDTNDTNDTNDTDDVTVLEQQQPPRPLPAGWILKEAKSQPGVFYHFNLATGESQWEEPQGEEEFDTSEHLLDSDDDDDENHESHVHSEGTRSNNKRQRAPLDTDDNAPKSSKRPKKTATPISSKQQQHELVEVRVLHILRKHKDSRRPSSRRKAVITNTLEEAREEMAGLLEILREEDATTLQDTFAELAKTESDCSSAKRGGDLGFFKRKKMQIQFEQAAFQLQVGELSGLVETNSGVHVLLRIG